MLSFVAVNLPHTNHRFGAPACWAVSCHLCWILGLGNGTCETGMKLIFSYWWVSQFSKCGDVRESRTWGSRVVCYRAVPGSRHTRRGSDPKNDVCITVLLEQILWFSFDPFWLSFFVRIETGSINSLFNPVIESRRGSSPLWLSIYVYIDIHIDDVELNKLKFSP